MNAKKKTLYEILEVSPHAPLAEIQVAHKRLSLNLVSEKTGMSREDIGFQLQLIDLAFQTLSVQASRDTYDVHLASVTPPNTFAGQVSAFATPPTPDALTLKVEAVGLKADTMSLRADAMSLRVDALSLRVTDTPAKIDREIHEDSQSAVEKTFSFISDLASPFKKALTLGVSLVAVGMVIQVVSALMMNNQQTRVTNEVAKAEEKVAIQEYYQEHGVRPASKAEAELLEAENRRTENAQREATLDKQRQDEEYKRFTEESRQMGERVSENLRRDEAQARRDEEQKIQRLEQARLNQEEADRQATEDARRRLGLN